ncbi:MAG TPA: DUF6644 family protein [Terriglobia bacterium]|nr:DUF6644 family protein [Terriglobia bacterium]
MDIPALLKSIESTGIATRIRESSYIFPFIESTHVFGLAMVFGTIAIIDLRLLGIASTQRSFKHMASDLLKWTWAAFALTAVTGALMFSTNADVYYHNFYFRTKMLMLVLAGINMLAFELTAGRTIHRWDKSSSAPLAGRATAFLSLIIWTSIIFLGREIGFTTSRAAVLAPPPADLNFDNLFDSIPTGNDSPGATPNKK